MGRPASILTVLMIAMAMVSACAHASSRSAGAPSRARTVLVGIGASDAVGIGATNPDQDNWIARLGATLPSGSRVVNLGISGATAAQAAMDELPVALDAAPTDVVIWLGVNDLQDGVPLERFQSSLRQIVSVLRSQAGSRVFVANLPDLKALPAFNQRDPTALDVTVAQWNDAIARICSESQARLVDVHAAWSALPDRAGLVSSDGLHPTTAGYQRIADLFHQTMGQAG